MIGLFCIYWYNMFYYRKTLMKGINLSGESVMWTVSTERNTTNPARFSSSHTNMFLRTHTPTCATTLVLSQLGLPHSCFATSLLVQFIPDPRDLITCDAVVAWELLHQNIDQNKSDRIKWILHLIQLVLNSEILINHRKHSTQINANHSIWMTWRIGQKKRIQLL